MFGGLDMTVIDNFSDRYEFLSNFYERPFIYNGAEYKTGEHAFQAAKTLDNNEKQLIIDAETPGKAKRLGRRVKLRDDWEAVKYDVMYEIEKAKFSDEEMKKMLISTGDAELIEGTTWHDNIWGNCTCERCKNIIGQNNLGKILMKVRDELK